MAKSGAFTNGSGAGPTSNGHNLVGTGTGCPHTGNGDKTVVPSSVFTKVLGPRDRHNLELQLALAFAYDQRGQYDEAEAEYGRLLTAANAGTLPESRRE